MGTCLRGSNVLWKTKLFQRLQLIQCASCSQLQNSSVKGSYPRISAPMKIKRSPTAILEALEETVGHECRDYGVYQIDDPFLYYNQYRKVSVMLANISGRKTGKLMAEKYAALFEGTPAHTPVEPPIEALNPMDQVKEDDIEEAIKEYIKRRDVDKVIELCESEQLTDGSTLSDETYESLIYFLSFHLETDHSITDAQEAELYNRVRGGKRYESLVTKFLSQERQTPELFNALLRFYLTSRSPNNVQNRKKQYEWSLKNKVPLERLTYHYLLANSRKVFDDLSIAKSVEKVMYDMKEAGYSPTLETFNHALMGLMWPKEFNNGDEAANMEFSLKLIAEMKQLGIEPSLDTWSIFLSQFDTQVFPKGRNSDVMRIMNSMMDEIEDKKFKDVGKEGRMFLPKAMKVALFHQDLDFAYRLDAFYKIGQNYKIMSDIDLYKHRMILFILAVYLESDMAKVVSLVTALQPVDEIYFIPGFRVFINSLKVTKSYQFIPDLLPTFQASHHCIHEILDFLADKKQPQMVQLKMSEYVKDLLALMTGFKFQKVRFYIQTYEFMMIIALNSDNMNLAWDVFSYLVENRKSIGGELKNIRPFEDLLNFYIDADDLRNCSEIVKFVAKDCPPEVAKAMIEKIEMNVPMNELERTQLEKMREMTVRTYRKYSVQ